MNICVFGLSHLGAVTAACLAQAGFQTIALDTDSQLAGQLKRGTLPSFEPGLAKLLEAGIGSGKLEISDNANQAVPGCNLLWVAFDTPVDEKDRADVEFVAAKVRAVFPLLDEDAVVLISTQLPVGTVAKLEREFRRSHPDSQVSFACSPENLRLGRAVVDFQHPERLVVGVRDDRAREVIGQVLERFTDQLYWMRVESAEMVKHALNSFLALCITFTNEVAGLCELTGADPAEVEAALRSDGRVGKGAYVKAGSAFGGGTLARDVTFLNELAAAEKVDLPLLDAILPSNENHRRWPGRQLARRLGELRGRNITVFGLAYKPGTDSLRRSYGVEVCAWLVSQQAHVVAFDPMVKELPDHLRASITLAESAEAALSGSEALLIATEWPQFKELTPNTVVEAMASPIVIDPGQFLNSGFAEDDRITYLAIGRPA